MNGNHKEGLDVVELPVQLSPKGSMMQAAKSPPKKLTAHSLFVMNQQRVRLFLGIFFHAIGLMPPERLHLEAHAETLLLCVEWVTMFLIGEHLKAAMTANVG